MNIYNYNKYSDFLVEKYGEKVYKLPVNIPCTCPNRDGKISFGGCTFCADEGVGFENMGEDVPLTEQIEKAREVIEKKYKSKKFVVYFQNFSNTYLPFDNFKAYMIEASENRDIVEIAIATRPDCLEEEHVLFLSELSKEKNIAITIELGLQTANYHTLVKINRGHTLAEYVSACIMIKRVAPEIDICTHVILNLPNDNMLDTIETAKIVSAVSTTHVKLHALFLMENTVMAKEYLAGEFEIISPEEYIERAIVFLEHLSQKVHLQRLIGRAPKEGSVFVNWGMSWKKVQNAIDKKMVEEGRFQGTKDF